MISIDTIEREIEELVSRRDTTYAVCEKLTYLFTVRDHLKPQASVQPVERKALGGSEFLDAVSAAPYEAVMRVLDEHMSTIQLIYPTTYDNVIKKIRELS